MSVVETVYTIATNAHYTEQGVINHGFDSCSGIELRKAPTSQVW